jgi:hypothetical protein
MGVQLNPPVFYKILPPDNGKFRNNGLDGIGREKGMDESK